jgi:hypothetical protein
MSVFAATKIANKSRSDHFSFKISPPEPGGLTFLVKPLPTDH